MNQKDRVMRWFLTASYLTKDQAKDMSINSISKVICELEKDGHQFLRSDKGYQLIKGQVEKNNSWITLLTGNVS
jgi:biotin operon repressor